MEVSLMHPLACRTRPRAPGLGWILPMMLAAQVAVGTRAAAQGDVWTGPWNWSCQMPLPCGGVQVDREFAHAALIPTGNWRGKVLLWRPPRHDINNGCPAFTETWIFDPASPLKLIKVAQDLDSDIFCSGATFDRDGVLVVAGGLVHGACTFPVETYYFNPLALPSTLVFSSDPCDPHELAATPFQQVADMNSSRYYPSLTTLLEGTIYGAPNPDIPGGSTWVCGGKSKNIACTLAFPGSDLWQFMPPGSGVWSRVFRSPNSTSPLITQPAAFEEYELKTLTGTSPNPYLENYPHPLQLANIGGFVKNILITNDNWPEGFAFGTAAGESWIARLRYDSAGPATQLWTGPSSKGGAAIDREWGTVVLMHAPSTAGPDGTGYNRVLLFGGQQQEAQGGQHVNKTVQEFFAGLDPAFPGTGATQSKWITKTTPLNFPRVYINAILLPTGKILIVGGFKDCDPDPATQSNLIPEPHAELYDPGPAGSVGGATVTLLSSQNASSPGFEPYARGYHNIACLLPDGRVFLAAGGAFLSGAWNCGTSTPQYEDGRFSGEIYSPPYMGYPTERPQILRAPDQVTFGQTFDVRTDHVDGLPVEGFALLRPASVTHHFDSDQRYIELAHAQGTPGFVSLGTERHLLTAPANDLGPAGYYMLFALRRSQTNPNELLPSQASFIKIL